jgi:hypothetical protein
MSNGFQLFKNLNENELYIQIHIFDNMDNTKTNIQANEVHIALSTYLKEINLQCLPYLITMQQ